MKRLYRSRDNRVIGGVCGGLGDYFDVDPVMVRLIWIILILFGGIGLMLYLVGWFIIPGAELDTKPKRKTKAAGEPSGKGRFWWGLALVMLGVYLWGSSHYTIYWPTIPGIQIYSRDIVPFVLMLVGIYVLYTFGRPTAGHSHPSHGIYRSRRDRKIGGVCGGLAEYFKVDPTVIRVIWVAGVFFYGATVLIYLILLVALPEKPLDADPEPSEV